MREPNRIVQKNKPILCVTERQRFAGVDVTEEEWGTLTDAVRELLRGWGGRPPFQEYTFKKGPICSHASTDTLPSKEPAGPPQSIPHPGGLRRQPSTHTRSPSSPSVDDGVHPAKKPAQAHPRNMPAMVRSVLIYYRTFFFRA